MMLKPALRPPLRAPMRGATTLREGGGVLTPPIGFVFPFGTYPFSVTAAGVTTFDPRSYFTAAFAGTTYYVDVATGNNGNTGLTTGQKLKAIHAAITKGNATAAPYNIVVTPGVYARQDGVSNSNTVFPTQQCAIVATGGRVLTGAMDNLTWTVNGTFANVYQATRSNVLRVVDLVTNDAFGDYVELTKVADLATCAITENSFAEVAGTTYVNRLDNAVVSDTNTRALLVADNVAFTSTSKSVYLENIDSIGGQNGSIYANGMTGNVMAKDCTFKFSGGLSNIQDNARMLNVTGLIAFVNCTANASVKDGFNFHRTAGSALSMVAILVGCTAKNNGRLTSTSNNGLTGHEDVPVIDVLGTYTDNYGGNVHFMNTAQLWAIRTQARRSKGDTSLGGTISPVEFRTEDTVAFWLDGCTADALTSGDLALQALGTSSIHKRNVTIVQGTESAAVGATIDTY